MSFKYQSQREAEQRYEQKFDQITVRLPKGSRAIIKEYATKSEKYEGSVNAMIRDLIEKEIGKSLD